MQEVRVRGAHVIAVASEGTDLGEHAEETLFVPATDWMLQPLLAVIPLQLLAYRIAACAASTSRSAAQPGQAGHRRIVTARKPSRPPTGGRQPLGGTGGQHELRAGGDQRLRRVIGVAFASATRRAADQPLVGGQAAQRRRRRPCRRCPRPDDDSIGRSSTASRSASSASSATRAASGIADPAQDRVRAPRDALRGDHGRRAARLASPARLSASSCTQNCVRCAPPRAGPA